ncbi:hypothetical protein C8Q80DRAFT_1271264 [Daedaleopsis nitida]|nr:hypothetical protein C8Q80DRAFT_1271264 [Daedaleopsis nitida]
MCAAFDLHWPYPAPALDDALLLPVLKILALLATAYAVHRSLSPPNPRPRQNRKVSPRIPVSDSPPSLCLTSHAPRTSRPFSSPTLSRTRLPAPRVIPSAPTSRVLSTLARLSPCTYAVTMITCAVVLADALVTLDLAFPNPYSRPLAARLLPSSSSTPPPPTTSPPLPSTLTATLTRPSPLLLLGAVLALSGAALRVWCFRTLGALFTFELTISPPTPSYTGVAATLAGASLAMLAPAAWLSAAWLAPGVQCALSSVSSAFSFSSSVYPSDSHSDSTTATAHGCTAADARGALLAWAVAAFWAAKVAYALRSTLRRVATEDAGLRRVFGAEWEAWAARVRWRLVPGVY